MSSISINISKDPLNMFNAFRINILSGFYQVLTSLNIKTLKAGVIEKIKRSVVSMMPVSEEFVAAVTKFTPEVAKKEHKRILFFLKPYRKCLVKMEDVRYFDDKDFELKCEASLLNFYRAEAIVRNKAYSEPSGHVSENDLTEFSANVSVKSLH